MEIFDLSKGKPDIKKMKENKDVDGLIKALEDENARMGVAEALAKIGEPAVEPLINAIKDEDKYVRSFVAIALANIKDERAVKPLINDLKNKSSVV